MVFKNAVGGGNSVERHRLYARVLLVRGTAKNGKRISASGLIRQLF